MNVIPPPDINVYITFDAELKYEDAFIVAIQLILLLSSTMIPLFLMSFPVVALNRASALSVALAGHTTSPVPPPVAAPRKAL